MALLIDLGSRKTPSLASPGDSKVRVGLYFFKPRDWFGWFIVALQWLTGGSWSSHCHMMHSVGGWLFETNDEGTMCSDRVDAAFRLADDVLYIMVEEHEAFELMEYSAFLVEENIAFRWQDCVRYCWTLLTTPKANRVLTRKMPFGESGHHLEQLLISPPFTCTAVVWDFLLEDKAELEWNDFTPAVAYDKMSQYIEEQRE